MATDLSESNGTAFNTNNMKPESANQTDALWGQNVGDNLASLWIRDNLLASITLVPIKSMNQDTEGTYKFKQHAAFGTIYGTVSGTFYNAAGAIDYFRLYIDGTEVLSGTLTSGGVTSFSETFTFSSTHLTHGQMYDISFFMENSDEEDTRISGNIWQTLT